MLIVLPYPLLSICTIYFLLIGQLGSNLSFNNSSSEYILCKVKEMGKITQEDIISLAMKDFEDLDQSGS